MKHADYRRSIKHRKYTMRVGKEHLCGGNYLVINPNCTHLVSHVFGDRT